EGPVDDPARKGDAQYARAIPVDDEEAERGLHPLIGTTTPCGASAGLAFVIRQWPSSTAPFAMMMTGASTSPVTRALASSTTCSLAVTFPTTSPRTTRVAVRTVARTTARSPMTRVSLDVISPENFASSITVPVHVYLPSISEPSSRKAPMRPGA